MNENNSISRTKSLKYDKVVKSARNFLLMLSKHLKEKVEIKNFQLKK